MSPSRCVYISVFNLLNYSQHNNTKWLQLGLQRHVSIHMSHRQAKIRTVNVFNNLHRDRSPFTTTHGPAAFKTKKPVSNNTVKSTPYILQYTWAIQ
jgi:hypothetical protein